MQNTLLSTHPCFSDTAHFKYGRIHMPVAPNCNISCRFCDRKFDCANESRPGVTSKVITPSEAADRLDDVLKDNPMLRVAGIAGPGEPLFNEASFETFSMIHERHPEMTLCVSSNGLLVHERLSDLIACGVSTLTVTVNALDTDAACKIYEDVSLDKTAYPDKRSRIEAFLRRQQSGLFKAVECGLAVKINTVLIPGINDSQIEGIAQLGRDAGACIMNIMPLIPCGKMKEMHSPTGSELQEARAKAEKYIPQFQLCRQCRADACGIPGRQKKVC